MNIWNFLVLALTSYRVILFAVFGIWSVMIARGQDSARFRLLAWVAAAVSAAFFAEGVSDLGQQTVSPNWLTVAMVGVVDSLYWAVAKEALVVGAGLTAFFVMSRTLAPLIRAEQMVEALTDRVPLLSVEDADLSPREQEVVAVIRSGRLSDREIADALYISPATAATHVRNILRKVGLNSRRDLVLLRSPQERAQAS